MKQLISCAGTAFAVLIAACSIQQQVKPVPTPERSGAKICVVEDKTVREGFLPAMRAALEARGMKVTVVASIAEAHTCPLYVTYIGNWRWDLAMYLAYAKITVFKGTTELGSATYDALLGGGRPDKFIDADNKIRELVNQLFP
jgi:hypothetical protein